MTRLELILAFAVLLLVIIVGAKDHNATARADCNASDDPVACILRR